MTKRRFEELRHEYLTIFARAVNSQLFTDNRRQKGTQDQVINYEAFIRVCYGGRTLLYLKRSILRIVKRRMLLAGSPWLDKWVQLVDNSVDNVDKWTGYVRAYWSK